jgi:hypothetical protein
MNIIKYKNKHPYQYKCLSLKFTDEDILDWAHMYSCNKDIISTFNIDYSTIISLVDFKKETLSKVEDYKVKQFVRKNFSNRYKSLLNEISYSYIKEIYMMGINKDIIKDQLFTNIRAFSTTELMNIRLKNFINLLKEFNLDTILEKAKSHSIRVISNENNILILHIENHTQARIIGNYSWCITRAKDHFENYQNKQLGGQYFFVWDFNKDLGEDDSMMAYNVVPRIKNNKPCMDIATKFSKNNASIKEKSHKKIDKKVINNTINEKELKKFTENFNSLDKFMKKNKSFEEFFKGRGFCLENMIDNKIMFLMLKKKYSKHQSLYKIKHMVLLDTYLFSLFDKYNSNIANNKIK